MEGFPELVNPHFVTERDCLADTFNNLRVQREAMIVRWQNAAQNRMAFQEAEIKLLHDMHHWGLSMRGK